MKKVNAFWRKLSSSLFVVSLIRLKCFKMQSKAQLWLFQSGLSQLCIIISMNIEFIAKRNTNIILWFKFGLHFSVLRFLFEMEWTNSQLLVRRANYCNQRMEEWISNIRENFIESNVILKSKAIIFLFRNKMSLVSQW